jgi:hypothetical protein
MSALAGEHDPRSGNYRHDGNRNKRPGRLLECRSSSTRGIGGEGFRLKEDKHPRIWRSIRFATARPQSGGIKVIFNGADCPDLAGYWVVSGAPLPSGSVSQHTFREYLERVARKAGTEALNPGKNARKGGFSALQNVN